jgi:CRP/FNR family transcriptional regulator, cyclic AMP receptor protein
VLLQRNRVKTLRRVPLFARCSTRELADIAAISYEKEFSAGSELTLEGAVGGRFFVLIEGTAEVQVGGETVRTLGPGDFAGEIALIAHTPRTASVRATSLVRTLVIPGRKFRALLGRQPDVQLTVLAALAERVPAAAR